MKCLKIYFQYQAPVSMFLSGASYSRNFGRVPVEEHVRVIILNWNHQVRRICCLMMFEGLGEVIMSSVINSARIYIS